MFPLQEREDKKRTNLLQKKVFSRWEDNIDMISFSLCLLFLVAGYFIYGKWVARMFGADDRPTPAVTKADGMDFIVMPYWKIFMIQFLNIAGTGPIFGTIMGMWFGPQAYLWIIFGCVFAGAVHDYMSGMLSMRNGGVGLPEIIGKYLGNKTRMLMLIFSVLLLVMVGVVFVYSPAVILQGIGQNLTGEGSFLGNIMLWIVVIFLYYIVATLLPVDKIIGRIYPLFAISLLFMALALLIGLFYRWLTVPDFNLPELWETGGAWNGGIAGAPAADGGLHNMGLILWGKADKVFPALFITIACGAISGFHATQSPLMARCMKSERYGTSIFYGAMITEGVVALVWATVSSYFFFYGGWKEVVKPEVVTAFLSQTEGGKTLIQYFTAPQVVKLVCDGWLGTAGGVLALLGVVAAPITSGDTAFRSARLIVADFLHLDQKPMNKRLYICLPMFAASVLMLVWQLENPDGFNTIWQYFGWANQTLSVFTLWAVTVYLALEKKPFVITMIPALFMTAVCSTFILISKNAAGLSPVIAYSIGGVIVVVAIVWFSLWYRKNVK